MTEPGPQDEIKLAKLREELQLLKGAPTITGQPTWMIFDPVQHRYFELDFENFQLLSMWNRHDDYEGLANDAAEKYGAACNRHRVKALNDFIIANYLAIEPLNGDWRQYYSRNEARRISPFKWLLHNYMFIRIPLVRPSRFLKATYPFVEFFLTRTFAIITILAGLTGLYFVSRQWDSFISTFSYFFSFEGVLIYMVALMFIKILHELGHAFMATKYGCRVPTMGVAFLVMFPVLYTDITDAWKLRSRLKRLSIGAAGMMVELSLASYATLLWVFLPDGGARSMAFVVATISWIMSVVINLNPFMRFDGYYLASDASGISNLQPRGFAFGRWKLREVLFGLGIDPPETLPVWTRRMLVIYAWSVWIYRFFLFTGIALLVYAMFFKVLGIFLFMVEIIWFIAKPVWSELKEWYAMRSLIVRRRRSLATLSVLVLAGFAATAPIFTRVDVPAIVEPAEYERLFPPTASRLADILVKPGQKVSKGQVLFRFESPQIEQRLRLVKINLAEKRKRLERAAADLRDKAQLQPLQSEYDTLASKRKGFERELERLTVRAPFDGQIQDISRQLHNGRWVKATQHLATIVDLKHFVAKGYIAENDLWRIKPGDDGKFIPDDFLVSSGEVRLREVSLASSDALQLRPLTSVYGGKIAVQADKDNKLVPVTATYRVTLDFDKTPADISKVSRGIVQINGKPESFASRAWRSVLKVMVRESGV